MPEENKARLVRVFTAEIVRIDGGLGNFSNYPKPDVNDPARHKITPRYLDVNKAADWSYTDGNGGWVSAEAFVDVTSMNSRLWSAAPDFQSYWFDNDKALEVHPFWRVAAS